MTDRPIWDKFTERLEVALEEAAADKSEADAIEERRKCAFSEMVNQFGGSVAKAEHEARGCTQYIKMTEQMITAKTRANMSAAKVKGMEARLEAWRTAESSRRAEMQLR